MPKDEMKNFSLRELLEDDMNKDFEKEIDKLIETLDFEIRGGEMSAVTADDHTNDITADAEDKHEGGVGHENKDLYPKDEHDQSADIEDSEIPVNEELEKGSPESTENRDGKEISDDDITVTNKELYPDDEHKAAEETKVEGEQEDDATRELKADEMQMTNEADVSEENMEPEIKAPHKDPEDYNKELEPEDKAKVEKDTEVVVTTEVVPADDPVDKINSDIEVDPMDKIEESISNIFKVLREGELEKGAPESTENRDAKEISDADIEVTTSEVYPADETKVEGEQEDDATRELKADEMQMTNEADEQVDALKTKAPSDSAAKVAKEKRLQTEANAKKVNAQVRASSVKESTDSLISRLSSLSESEIDAILEELEKGAPESTENRDATEIADPAIEVTNAEVYPADEHKQAEETKVEGEQEDDATRELKADEMSFTEAFMAKAAEMGVSLSESAFRKISKILEELEKGAPESTENRVAKEISDADIEVTTDEVYPSDEHKAAEEIKAEGEQEDDASRELEDKEYSTDDEVLDDIIECMDYISYMSKKEIAETFNEEDFTVLESILDAVSSYSTLQEGILKNVKDRIVSSAKKVAGAVQQKIANRPYEKALKNRVREINSKAKARVAADKARLKAERKENAAKAREDVRKQKAAAKAAIKSGNLSQVQSTQQKLRDAKAARAAVKPQYKDNLAAAKAKASRIAKGLTTRATNTAKRMMEPPAISEAFEMKAKELGFSISESSMKIIFSIFEELEKGAPESTEDRAAVEVADNAIEVTTAEVYPADEHKDAEEIKVEGEQEDDATRELPSKDYGKDKAIVESLVKKGYSRSLVEAILSEIGIAGIAPLDVPAGCCDPTKDREAVEIKAVVTNSDVYPADEHTGSEEIDTDGVPDDEDEALPRPLPDKSYDDSDEVLDDIIEESLRAYVTEMVVMDDDEFEALSEEMSDDEVAFLTEAFKALILKENTFLNEDTILETAASGSAAAKKKKKPESTATPAASRAGGGSNPKPGSTPAQVPSASNKPGAGSTPAASKPKKKEKPEKTFKQIAKETKARKKETKEKYSLKNLWAARKNAKEIYKRDKAEAKQALRSIKSTDTFEKAEKAKARYKGIKKRDYIRAAKEDFKKSKAEQKRKDRDKAIKDRDAIFKKMGYSSSSIDALRKKNMEEQFSFFGGIISGLLLDEDYDFDERDVLYFVEEMTSGAPESTENRDAVEIPDAGIEVTNAEVYPADEHKQAEETKVEGEQEDDASKPVPEDQLPIVKESFVAYGSLKEAFMVEDTYFTEDSYVKVSPESKIEKLTEQIALLMCKESEDPIFSELVKHASFVKKLEESACKKYGKAAKDKAEKLVEAKCAQKRKRLCEEDDEEECDDEECKKECDELKEKCKDHPEDCDCDDCKKLKDYEDKSKAKDEDDEDKSKESEEKKDDEGKDENEKLEEACKKKKSSC